jgi:hypothetical protein
MRTRWTIALFAAGLALGQQRVQISAVERVGADVDDQVPAILERLSQLTLGPLSDTAAKSMLAASVAGSARFLRWHLEELIGATTITDHETDVLVAHWANTGSDVDRTDVWLWDDPIGCYFFLPFPLEAMNDRSRLEKFFESMWIWWEPDPEPERPDPANPNRPRTPQRIRLNDPRTRTFRLKLALPPLEGLFGTGGAEGDPGFERPRPGRGRPGVRLYRRGSQVWVAIRIGKPWMETPSGMYEIAERFPPLRERSPSGP